MCTCRRSYSTGHEEGSLSSRSLREDIFEHLIQFREICTIPTCFSQNTTIFATFAQKRTLNNKNEKCESLRENVDYFADFRENRRTFEAGAKPSRRKAPFFVSRTVHVQYRVFTCNIQCTYVKRRWESIARMTAISQFNFRFQN